MINTINHIGLGTQNLEKVRNVFVKDCGFKMKLGNSTYDIWELEEMFGHSPPMQIVNYMHPFHGPALELFHHKKPAPSNERQYFSKPCCDFAELGINVTHIDQVCRTWAVKYLPIGKIRSITVRTRDQGSENSSAEEVWRIADFQTVEGIRIQLVDKGTHTHLKPGVLGISHIGIRVSNMHLMKKFYTDTLEFDEILDEFSTESPKITPHPPIIWLRKKDRRLSEISAFDGGVIKLIQAERSKFQKPVLKKRFGTGGIAEIGLEVKNIETTYQKLVEGGAEGVVCPTPFSQTMGPKGLLAYIRDPEGNVIELVELKKVFLLPIRQVNNLIVKPLKKAYVFFRKHNTTRSCQCRANRAKS